MEPTRRAFIAATVASVFTLPSCMSARAADRDRREERREDRRDDRREDARKDDPRRDGRWEKLGERRVSKKEEHDSIDLNNKQRFTAVWFEVERGAIELDDIEITFGNNEKFKPDVRLTFREGERTRVIDLPDGDKGVRDREIVKIRFHYRSVGRGEATIVAWGRAFEGKR